MYLYKNLCMLELIYKDHKKWINTVLKFGCSKEDAEDIVSDMYYIIGNMLNKGLDIAYKGEVNYYYIYLTLRTNFLKNVNQKNKENKVSLDLCSELTDSSVLDFARKNDKVLDLLDTFHWYDKKIYTLIQKGYSFTDLSNKTNIGYYSIYNTYRKVKDKLKVKLLEE